MWHMHSLCKGKRAYGGTQDLKKSKKGKKNEKGIELE